MSSRLNVPKTFNDAPLIDWLQPLLFFTYMKIKKNTEWPTFSNWPNSNDWLTLKKAQRDVLLAD